MLLRKLSSLSFIHKPCLSIPGIKEYVKQQNIVAYGFDVDCAGPDNCKLKDDFLGALVWCFCLFLFGLVVQWSCLACLR